MSHSRAVIILSGGLDSSVCFYQALQSYKIVLALTFDYGQRAFIKEKKAAFELSQKNDVPHETISLPWLKQLGNSALNHLDSVLPSLNKGTLDHQEETQKSAKAVWIPNRNGLFINIAACYAEDLNAEIILTGFNREEAITFPDNSSEFVEGVNRSLFYSTQIHSQVKSLTQKMNKEEIVKKGLELKVPFETLWSCYQGMEKMCGKCESCLRLKRGLEKNGILEKWSDLFLA